MVKVSGKDQMIAPEVRESCPSLKAAGVVTPIRRETVRAVPLGDKRTYVIKTEIKPVWKLGVKDFCFE